MLFTVYRANGSQDRLHLHVGDHAVEHWFDEGGLDVCITEVNLWSYILTTNHPHGLAVMPCESESLRASLIELKKLITLQRAHAPLKAPLPF